MTKYRRYPSLFSISCEKQACTGAALKRKREKEVGRGEGSGSGDEKESKQSISYRRRNAYIKNAFKVEPARSDKAILYGTLNGAALCTSAQVTRPRSRAKQGIKTFPAGRRSPKKGRNSTSRDRSVDANRTRSPSVYRPTLSFPVATTACFVYW